jgi:hypothetical protein
MFALPGIGHGAVEHGIAHQAAAADTLEPKEYFRQRLNPARSDPLTGAQVAEIAGRHLGRPVKLRTASVFMLRLVSLFSKDLRGFMQVVPDYVKPIAYDASRLEGLMGKAEMTSYHCAHARRDPGSSGEGVSYPIPDVHTSVAIRGKAENICSL